MELSEETKKAVVFYSSLYVLAILFGLIFTAFTSSKDIGFIAAVSVLFLVTLFIEH